MKIRSLLIASALFFSASAASAGLSFDASATTTGGNLNAVQIGDTVTLNIRIISSGTPAIFGLGAAVQGYDSAVVTFQSGTAVTGYLFETCIPSVGCFNGLDNLSAPTLTQQNQSGVGNFVQIANSASLTGRTGTGAQDPGLDAVIGGGDAQFRLVFQAVANGTTTFQVGGDPALGNVAVLAGGATEAITNDTVTITVPEPGSILLGLVALGTTAGLIGARRRLV